MNFADRLVAQELRNSLGQSVIGSRIIVLKSTGSTNDFLVRMLTPGLPEGLVVFAEEQTAGRGQRGRRWISASHLGLWFSILLRPRLRAAESACLTDWAANAIATTIRSKLELQPTIKLPNDIYLHGRKLAGVLAETKVGKGEELAAIVGIGVNLNQQEDDFPRELRQHAGSLAMVLGKSVDRSAFAIALLQELERTRTQVLSTAFR